MPLFNSNDIQLFYEIHGTGAPLVLIAGLGTDHAYWYPILDNLKDNFQIILFDNRGVGQTSAPEGSYTTEQMANDVAALLNYLNISSAHILGHSVGGMIAQQFAINYPALTRSLILYSTFVKMDARTLHLMKFNGKLFAAHVKPEIVMENIVLWMYSPHFLANEKNIQHAVEAMLAAPAQSHQGFLGQLTAARNHDVKQTLNNITAPTLILQGGDDIYSTAKQARLLHANINNSVLIEMENIGHQGHLEQPDMFVETINNFMSIDYEN